MRQLQTVMFFEDSDDPVLNSVRHKSRLIAQKTGPHAYRFDNGFMHPGDAPGHGVAIDEALAAKYPYQRAYLPVNRQQHDGTLWHW